MKRTTLFLDEETDSDLKAIARRQGRPVAGLVREAIETYVSQQKRPGKVRLGFLAQGRSGYTDTAERHEELLWSLSPSRPPAPAPTPAKKRRRRKPSSRG
jgi:predicted transcriptional regulator